MRGPDVPGATAQTGSSRAVGGPLGSEAGRLVRTRHLPLLASLVCGRGSACFAASPGLFRGIKCDNKILEYFVKY